MEQAVVIPTWEFEVEGRALRVAAATLYAAIVEAQKLVDSEYGRNRYTVVATAHKHDNPAHLVAVVATAPRPAGRVWEYRYRIHKGTRDELYVTDRVEANIPAAAANKAQTALDARYGPGEYRVSVMMGPNKRPYLHVEVIG